MISLSSIINSSPEIAKIKEEENKKKEKVKSERKLVE